MTQINVDHEKCKFDGICSAVCPMGIIALKDGSTVPKLAPGLEELCICRS